MRIQADSVAVVIDRCMTDSNVGHGGVGLLKDIQINTLCASERDDAADGLGKGRLGCRPSPSPACSSLSEFESQRAHRSLQKGEHLWRQIDFPAAWLHRLVVATDAQLADFVSRLNGSAMC
jgi:hypothetical protein